MTDHGARAHATWSASATDRNWNCSGALALAASLQIPDRESEAAAWGTACHQISEKCLPSNTDAITLAGTVEKTKEHEFEVDDELIETAQEYIDYVRAQAEGSTFTFIEQRFSLEKLDPPFDAGGTADAVIYHAKKQSLEVIDLKGGRGVVVEVKGNPQLRTYALGALLANPKLDVRTVTVTIVQPRVGHKDGRIRSETFQTWDLLEWTADLLKAMRKAKAAMEWRGQIADSAWSHLYLSAGSHCKFCPAMAICPAIEQKTNDAVGVWFDDLSQPRFANTPDTLSPEELAKRLDLVDMIEDWIAAVRAHAHTMAEMGVEIPAYRLVEKEGRRAWAADETKVASDLVNVVGLRSDDIYEVKSKLRSPAQIEKVLGKKRKDAIANMWHRPKTGTNLVRADKTNRPAAKSVTDQFFDVLS